LTKPRGVACAGTHAPVHSLQTSDDFGVGGVGAGGGLRLLLWG